MCIDKLLISKKKKKFLRVKKNLLVRNNDEKPREMLQYFLYRLEFHMEKRCGRIALDSKLNFLA